MPITLIGSAGIYGGIVPFDPTQISGCKLWLRSDKGVTKDESDLVSLWADQSGQHNDASQLVDDNKFTFNANQINGHPSLGAEAGPKYMTADGVAPYFNGNDVPFSVFLISKRIGDIYGVIWSCANTFNNAAKMYFGTHLFRGHVNAMFVVRFDDTQVGSSFVISGGVAINYNWHSWIFNFKGTTMDVYIDGVLVIDGESLDVGNLATLNTFSLNCELAGGSPALWANAEFAEFGVYSKELSSDEITLLNTYSTSRYGL